MDAEVLVVGGSFAGTSLALALARRGRRVLVVERLSAPPRVCKADVMQARTVEILQEWEAEPVLLAGSVPLTHYAVGFAGRPTVRVDLRPIFGIDHPLRAVDHQLLLPGLRRLAEEAGASFMTGKAGAALTEGNAITGVRLADGTALRARLTVGADGPHSVVRRGMQVREQRQATSASGSALVLTLAEAPPPEATLVFGSGGRGAFAVPLPGNRLRLYCGAPDPVLEADRLKQALAELMPWWQEGLAAATEPVWPVPRMHTMTVPSWVADGAALVGDAGNVVWPHAGQGMNLAIQGARALCEAYCAVPATGPVRAADLAGYDQAMRRRAALVQRMTRGMGKPQQALSPGAVRAAEWGLRMVSRLPWAVRPLALTFAGYRHGL